MKKLGIPLLIFAVAACASESDAELANQAALEAPATTEIEAAPLPAVTDAQIADIVLTANQVDVDAGELASATSTNPEVQAFAERMITDHNGVNEAATELATRLGVTPEANPVSQQLRQGGEANLEALSALSGAEFDSAYIAHEVTYHQAVLDALDNTLIPSAQNAELKALLVSVRPAFVAHLEHAQQLQGSLAG
ncbi:MAG TPA: DUF4142 domain-containing protein [Longimicrobiaceae bacterium]|nr:DUF4142 domain-containing protein [Longimicrobiaceae bacterium]